MAQAPHEPNIAGIGAVLLDSVIHVDNLPSVVGLPEPDTKMYASGEDVAHVSEKLHLVAADQIHEAVGGPVPIALKYSYGLGAKARFAGVVGRDHNGEIILKDLVEAGIDTRHVFRVEGETGRSVIWLDNQGARSILVSDSTLRPLSSSLVTASFLDNVDLLHIDGREPDAAFAAALQVRQQKGRVYLDVGNWKPKSEKLLHVASIAQFPARSAAECLKLDEYALDLQSAANAIRRKYGLQMAIVTNGEDGLGYANRLTSGRIASHQVDAVDTNGAGDVFAGIMTYCVANGENLVNALYLANAGAGMKCETEGHDRTFSMDDLREARLGIPTRELASVEYGPTLP